ncbi:MAG: THUMP domain-containing protein [Saprospiraceae bacterium]
MDLTSTFIIKTFAGLEPVLAEELKALGAEDVVEIKRAVRCSGDQKLMYRANYELRTALKVLQPIHTFKPRMKMNYTMASGVSLVLCMKVTDTLAGDAVASGVVFKHSKYLALLTKDAIVDQFRDRIRGGEDQCKHRGSYLEDKCQCSSLKDHCISSSGGDSLHRRVSP